MLRVKIPQDAAAEQLLALPRSGSALLAASAITARRTSVSLREAHDAQPYIHPACRRGTDRA
jgi:hypothetical protein